MIIHGSLNKLLTRDGENSRIDHQMKIPGRETGRFFRPIEDIKCLACVVWFTLFSVFIVFFFQLVVLLAILLARSCYSHRKASETLDFFSSLRSVDETTGICVDVVAVWSPTMIKIIRVYKATLLNPRYRCRPSSGRPWNGSSRRPSTTKCRRTCGSHFTGITR